MNESNSSRIPSLDNAQHIGWVKPIFITLAIVFAILGVCGNIFVIILAAKYTARKNLHHLIINIAIADTAMALLISSVVLSRLFGVDLWNELDFTPATILCKTFAFIGTCVALISLLSLLMISVERFRVTRSTLQILRPYSSKQRIVRLACLWLVSFVLPAYQAYDVRLLKKWDSLQCDNVTERASDLCYYVFSVILFLASLKLNALTLRNLTKPRPIEDSLSEIERLSRKKRTAKVIKMVMCSLLLYALSCFPNFVVGLIHKLSQKTESNSYNVYAWSVTFSFLQVLPVVNSCFSPCIYMFFLSDFREAAKKLLCRSRGIDPRRVRIKNVEEPQVTETGM